MTIAPSAPPPSGNQPQSSHRQLPQSHAAAMYPPYPHHHHHPHPHQHHYVPPQQQQQRKSWQSQQQQQQQPSNATLQQSQPPRAPDFHTAHGKPTVTSSNNVAAVVASNKNANGEPLPPRSHHYYPPHHPYPHAHLQQQHHRHQHHPYPHAQVAAAHAHQQQQQPHGLHHRSHAPSHLHHHQRPASIPQTTHTQPPFNKNGITNGSSSNKNGTVVAVTVAHPGYPMPPTTTALLPNGTKLPQLTPMLHPDVTTTSEKATAAAAGAQPKKKAVKKGLVGSKKRTDPPAPPRPIPPSSVSLSKKCKLNRDDKGAIETDESSRLNQSQSPPTEVVTQRSVPTQTSVQGYPCPVRDRVVMVAATAVTTTVALDPHPSADSGRMLVTAPVQPRQVMDATLPTVTADSTDLELGMVNGPSLPPMAPPNSTTSVSTSAPLSSLAVPSGQEAPPKDKVGLVCPSQIAHLSRTVVDQIQSAVQRTPSVASTATTVASSLSSSSTLPISSASKATTKPSSSIKQSMMSPITMCFERMLGAAEYIKTPGPIKQPFKKRGAFGKKILPLNVENLRRRNSDGTMNPFDELLEDPDLERMVILQMAMQRQQHGNTNAAEEKVADLEKKPACRIISEGFFWREYPCCEGVLYMHMEKYYEISAIQRNYKVQQGFNNVLVEQVRAAAIEHGFEVDPNFDDKKLRDRIRCFYKTHLQNAKKRLATLAKHRDSVTNQSLVRVFIRCARNPSVTFEHSLAMAPTASDDPENNHRQRRRVDKVEQLKQRTSLSHTNTTLPPSGMSLSSQRYAC